MTQKHIDQESLAEFRHRVLGTPTKRPIRLIAWLWTIGAAVGVLLILFFIWVAWFITLTLW